MALNPGPADDTSLGKVIPQQSDRILDDFDDGDAGRSNFAAFLLGGVVIAGGMLAFLYYDSDNVGRGDITTGSIGRTELQAAPPVPSIQVPMQPPRPTEPR